MMTPKNQPDQKINGACMMRIAAPVILLCLLFCTPTVSAQDTDMSTTEPMNRISIGLQGGLATGNMDINTKYTGVYGGNVRYSFNPMISLQANVLFGKFISDEVVCELFDIGFDNRYSNINVQGHLNMFPFLSKENAPEGFKIYSLLGFGLIRNDVTTEVENPDPGWEDFTGEDNTDSALYYQFGLGTRIKLSERVDLFSQFEYNVSAIDQMDGFRDSRLRGTDLDDGKNDHFINFTAGLQFKFGSSGRKHADWHWPSPPPPPAPMAPEPEPVDDNRIEELEEELDEKQQQIDELYNALKELEDAESVEQVDDRVIVTFNNAVLFDFDSSELKPQVVLSLDHLLQEIDKADGDAEDLRLTIVGHTDSIGTEEYNQGLSERRAASVTSYLIENGFDSNRVISLGRGETEPKFDNDTREGRAKNRRVEIMIE